MSDEHKDSGAVTTITDDAELDSIRAAIDDPQVLKEQLTKEATARRQITARAIAAEEENKVLKPLAEKQRAQEMGVDPERKVETQLPNDVEDERLDLRLDGYSKGEVDWIMKNGGRKQLEDTTSYVSLAIKTKREQERAEMEAGKVSDTSGMSEVERKYTPEQLKAMSVEELKKILPKA